MLNINKNTMNPCHNISDFQDGTKLVQNPRQAALCIQMFRTNQLSFPIKSDHQLMYKFNHVLVQIAKVYRTKPLNKHCATYSVSGGSVEIVQRFAQQIGWRLSKLSFSARGISKSGKPSRRFLQHFLSALDSDYNPRNFCGFHQRFIPIKAISDMIVINHFWSNTGKNLSRDVATRSSNVKPYTAAFQLCWKRKPLWEDKVTTFPLRD